LEAAMGGTTGTDVGGIQGVPLAPSTQHEENGIHGFAIIDTGPMAPQRVQLPRREQRLDVCPQLVGHAPITAYLLLVGIHRAGSCGRVAENFCRQDTIKTTYWDRPLASALETWIEDYNAHYLHSALGYKPPRQFEREYHLNHGTQFVAA
jgi:hypothetical protein